MYTIGNKKTLTNLIIKLRQHNLSIPILNIYIYNDTTTFQQIITTITQQTHEH